MAVSRQELEQLVGNPRESLGTELKRWIDPATPEGTAKVAIGCMALRNNNGGCLVVGFQDDCQPDPATLPDVQGSFHTDVIQGIVSKYASQSSSVSVEFIDRDGVSYPVICVPSGVESPVAAKANFPNPDPKKPPLIKRDTVYVRTLDANGTASSSAAGWKDWPQIVRHCFENREADIGAFLRRHLSTVDPRQLRMAVKSLRPSPLASELSLKLLDAGLARFKAEAVGRGTKIPAVGTMEVAVVIDGVVPPQDFDCSWVRRIRGSAPDHSGWPVWVDMSNANIPEIRPYFIADGNECFIYFPGERLDFWRMDPAGKFYCIRAFWDDMGKGPHPAPGKFLDPAFQIGFVTEVLSVCQSFARTMGCDEQATALECAFRWTGLEGRLLANWSNPHG